MRDIRAVVNSDPAKTRATFAKHIERITLTPSGEHCVASGTWNFVGRGSIGGAGGGSGPNVCRFGLSGWLLCVMMLESRHPPSSNRGTFAVMKLTSVGGLSP